jgi:hypothetical protein
MLNIESIKPGMPVVCSEGGQCAVVDHLEGADTVKLTKDESGEHHYIPVDWVTAVDEQVHIDRPGKQAKSEWRNEASEAARKFRELQAFAPDSTE